MRVLKRAGSYEAVDMVRVTERLRLLADQEPCVSALPIDKLVDVIARGVYDGIPTTDIDKLATQGALFLSVHEPRWLTLAQRIVLTDLYKRTPCTIVEYLAQCESLLAPEFTAFIRKHRSALESYLDHQRDALMDVFAVLSMESKYLLRKTNGQVVERPQWLYLRVAVALGMPSLEQIRTTYDALSKHTYTHATPVLFNAGLPTQQLASCFLFSAKDDLEELMQLLRDLAFTSKYCGGVGLNISMLRSRGSRIASVAGASSGIVPFCRVLYQLQQWINQGGRRPGAMSLYIEPWHADIVDFLNLRLRTTSEEFRCLELNTALWIPDLFMKRLRQNADWSLFDPNTLKTPLYDVHGDAFEQAYIEAENTGRAVRTIPARSLWEMVVKSLQETGQPYIHFKDTVNALSNQQNIGTIRGSNLCSEIMQVSNDAHTAVCNLASISLPACVVLGKFSFEALYDRVAHIVRTVDRALDRCTLSSSKAERSNEETRPMGIGIQGLADTFHMLGLAWGSTEALAFDRDIHEVMYHAAVSTSTQLAKEFGSYAHFTGSPLSRGVFHWELFAQRFSKDGSVCSSNHDVRRLCDWNALRERVMSGGCRNSVWIALMPTVSTSTLLGNHESFEPYTSNAYVRRLGFGDHLVFNRHLAALLKAKKMWTVDIVDHIRREKGSVATLPGLSDDEKRRFRTVWEMTPRTLMEHALSRAPFVDQSQSLNLYWKDPDLRKITSAVYFAWSSGLKTASYYTRVLPATSGTAFAVPLKACSRTDPTCESCSA